MIAALIMVFLTGIIIGVTLTFCASVFINNYLLKDVEDEDYE